MSSSEQLNFNAPHAPQSNAIEAFNIILSTIKQEVIKSRNDWDKHEPRMWSRATGLSDAELTSFSIEKDLVEVRSAATTYGTIILGKIRLPAVQDGAGEGFLHVRIHDPPNRGAEDIIFHSLFTDEIRDEPNSQPIGYCAIQTVEKPLRFFNE
ncbi:hypothetical protein CPB83DRAFT_861893 [Crepidotus variabilis]|uniref:Uncharacterized protein n=1 Tax=Crepidotus variabilis TaxID=179855 RepID=A0A9P6E7B5_9AGAR|nr:hypothetical protein CPB83DRAFT_861893 [Crepidotus variabilis]